MKTKLVSCLLLLLQMTSVFAQGEQWQCDAYDYQYDMTVYVALNVDGSDADLESYQVAAFCGEECRGVMEILTHGDQPYGYLRVRSNRMENEKISFRIYDRVSHQLLKSADELDFKKSSVIGYPSSPQVIHAVHRFATYFVSEERIDTLYFYYGEAVTAPGAPQKEGHTFKGWTPEVAATMPAHDLTYEAVYEVNVYAVTYQVDGVVFQTDSVAYGAPLTAPAAPQKEGHTFKGWTPEVAATMPAHNLTHEAVYEVNVYAVTYQVDGVVFQTDSVAYGAPLTAPAAPQKEGHTFKGWTPEVAATMPAHNLTYEAVYEVNVYKLTYYLNDELYAELDVAYGKEIEPLEVETEENEVFSGWQNLPEFMPAHDVKVYGSLTLTAIETLVVNIDDCTVYSLSGDLLLKSVPWQQVKRLLPKGVYVVNGKKVYVR